MATTSLGRLTLDLVAQIGQYVGPLNQAERQTTDSTNKMNKAFSSFKDQMNQSLNGSQIGSVIEGISGKLGSLQGSLLSVTAAAAGMAVGGIVVAAGRLSVLAIETAKNNVEMMRFAAISNTSIATFQGLAGAAQTFGITQEQLSDQLKDFNEKLGEFASVGAGGATDFFEQIAVKTEGGAEGAKKLAEEMSKMDGVAALQTYVDKLEEAGVNQQQMSFYLESMGSDLTKIAPLLVNGGQLWKDYQKALEDAGVITGQEAAEQSMVLAAQTESLQLQFGALKNQLAQAVMPALSGVIGYFLDGSGKGGQFAGIVEAVGVAAKGAAVLVVGLAGGIKNLVTLISGAMNLLGNLGQTAVNVWNAPTFKDKGRALVDGFINNGNILVNTAKSVVDTTKNTFGTISNVVSSQAGEYDALTKSIINNQKAQQEWAKKTGKGVTSGIAQNKELNPEDKKGKSAPKTKGKSEADREMEKQEKLQESIVLDFSTDMQKMAIKHSKTMSDINSANFSPAIREQYLSAAQARFDDEKKLYKMKQAFELSEFKLNEEAKAQAVYIIDQQEIANRTDITTDEKSKYLVALQEKHTHAMAWLRLEQNQRLNDASQSFQTEMQNISSKYAFEREQILLNEKLTDDERKTLVGASHITESQDLAKGRDAAMYGYLDASGIDTSAEQAASQRAEAFQSALDWQLITQEEYQRKMLDSESQYYRAKAMLGLDSATETLGTMTGLFGSIFGEQSKAYAAMFALEKGFAVAKAMMAIPESYSKAYNAVVGIPYVGPYLAPVMGGAAAAAQVAQAAMIRNVNLTGMAHDGIDYVPKEGTWLLDKGERVLSPRQNADFTRSMNERKVNSNQNQSSTPPQVNVRVMNSWDESEFFDAIATPTGEKIVMNIIKRNRSKLGI